MSLEQTVKIELYQNGELLPNKTKTFTGTKEKLIKKMKGLQKEYSDEGEKIEVLQQREKTKKGLGVVIITEANHSEYLHKSFWPVKLEKPNLMLNNDK